MLVSPHGPTKKLYNIRWNVNLPTVTQSGKVPSNTIYFSQMRIHLIQCKKIWISSDSELRKMMEWDWEIIRNQIIFIIVYLLRKVINVFILSAFFFFFGKYAITQKSKVIKEERTECFDLRTKLIAVSCLLPTPLSVGTSAKLLFFSSSVLICKAGCGLVQS